MSKSLGNVVSPQEMTKRLGVDGLRLWAASIDCSSDAVVSDQLLRNIEQTFNKIRNTCRFLLSNLYDFDHERDMVTYEQMLPLDQYACAQLFDLNRVIMQSYQEYDFTAIAHRLGDYCTAELSAFYLDIIKDRLYVEKADGHERRSAQTACWYILDTMTRLMAPILSITAEYVSDAYQKNKRASIHLQQFTSPDDVWAKLAKHQDVPAYATAQDQQWKLLKSLRSALLKSIEELRAVGTITHSLEARLTLYLDAMSMQTLQPLMHMLRARDQSLEEFLQEFVIVSQIIVTETEGSLSESVLKGLYVNVERTHGVKCPRCWKWHTDKHVHDLCGRCNRIVR
jgi:isoleucyl-tRNA synthetase